MSQQGWGEEMQKFSPACSPPADPSREMILERMFTGWGIAGKAVAGVVGNA